MHWTTLRETLKPAVWLVLALSLLFTGADVAAQGVTGPGAGEVPGGDPPDAPMSESGVMEGSANLGSIDLTPVTQNGVPAQSPVTCSVRILSPGNGGRWASVRLRNTSTAPFHGELVIGLPYAEWRDAMAPSVIREVLLEAGESVQMLLPVVLLADGSGGTDVLVGPVGMHREPDMSKVAVLEGSPEFISRDGPTEEEWRGFRRRRRMAATIVNPGTRLAIGVPPAVYSGVQYPPEVFDGSLPSGYPAIPTFYSGVSAEVGLDPAMPAEAREAMAKGLRGGSNFLVVIRSGGPTDFAAASQIVRMLTGTSAWGEPEFIADAAAATRAAADARDGRVLAATDLTGPSGLAMVPVTSASEPEEISSPRGINPRIPGAAWGVSGSVPEDWIPHFVTYRVGLGTLTVVRTDSPENAAIDPWAVADAMSRVRRGFDGSAFASGLDVAPSMVIPPGAAVLLVLVYVLAAGPVIALLVRRKRPLWLVPATAAVSLGTVLLIVVVSMLLGVAADDRREVVVTFHGDDGKPGYVSQIMGHLQGHSPLPVSLKPGTMLRIGSDGYPSVRPRVTAMDSGMVVTTTGYTSSNAVQLTMASAVQDGRSMAFEVSGNRVTNRGELAVRGGFLVTRPLNARLNPMIVSVIPPLAPGATGELSYQTIDRGALPFDEEELTLYGELAGVDASESSVGIREGLESPCRSLNNRWSVAIVVTETPAGGLLVRRGDDEAVGQHCLSVCPVKVREWPVNPLIKVPLP